MQYQLKAPKASHTVFTVLSTVLFVAALTGAYISFQTGNMMKLIFAFSYVILGGLAFLVSFNNLTKCLTFNNVSLTFDGKTYSYGQIERIGAHGGRHGRIFYTVYIDGKKFYTFEKNYTGAKEFFYYLDFYKVPGAPRA